MKVLDDFCHREKCAPAGQWCRSDNRGKVLTHDVDDPNPDSAAIRSIANSVVSNWFCAPRTRTRNPTG
jgi:hypothetical protein